MIINDKGNQEKDKARAILKKRLEEGKRRRTLIQPQGVNCYPVSSIQRHMLESEAMSMDYGTYNLVSCVEIIGVLNVMALEKSVNQLIQDNGSLRTRFFKENDEYRQLVEDHGSLNIEFINLLDEPCQEQVIDEIIAKASVEKMYLNRAPLLKVIVVKRAINTFIMIIATHHTIVDGWSFGIIVRQIQKYYGVIIRNETLISNEEEISYIDYCIWKNHENHDCREYWIKELDGAKILRLECDSERKVQASHQGQKMYFNLDQNLIKEMRTFCKLNNVTMSNLVLTAYQILFSLYTGQKDFVIGIATANRDHLAIRSIIGCFINTLTMRARVDECVTVKEHLIKVQEKSYEMNKNKDVDLFDIIDMISCERDSRYPLLFQVMYNYENTPMPKIELEGLQVNMWKVDTCNALFDLTLTVFDNAKAITGVIEYKSKLFSYKRIKRLSEYLIHIIASVVRKSEFKVKDLSLLSERQELEILKLNLKKKVENKLFIEQFKNMVRKFGEKEAVCSEGASITYNQLDEQSEKLAYMLTKRMPFKSFVGVNMEKTIESIIVIMALFKSGMIYVPLDSSYPPERIRYIIDDANISTVITNTGNKDISNLKAAGIEIVLYAEELLEINEVKGNHEAVSVDSEDIAYLIYTSGSTGNPKGVMVPHRGLCNVVQEQKCIFFVDSSSKILQFASFCFDASIFEIVMALGNGGTLCMVSKQSILGDQLAKYIRKNNITHICVTPSVLSLTNQEGLDSLKVVIVAGEPCPDSLVAHWSNGRKFFNAYGPTEATIWTTTAQCFVNKKVTVGKALANVEAYVLGEQFQLIPKGMIGELYIGGIGLCKGYLNRDEINRNKFITKTFSNGYETVLYASGDLVRWNDDDELEFIGRKDNQIKVRGFRIETDEIRNQIMEYPGVYDAVVGVSKENSIGLLYAVVKSNLEDLDIQGLKHLLKRKLPSYMVPGVIQIVGEIPLNESGKTDYKAIEEILTVNHGTKINLIQPKTEIQSQLLNIWKEILGVESIGVDDNFFDMGGHSLTATKLVNRLNERFHAEFSNSMVFHSPTILDMEKKIKSIKKVEINVMKPVSRERRLPMSSQQRQLWFLEQMGHSDGSYHIIMPIHLTGSLDANILEKSFGKVIDNHEILNVRFKEEDGVPYQIVERGKTLRMNHCHIIGLDAISAMEQVNHLISSLSNYSFNLSEDLLVRAVLINLSENENVLVIIMHHIISDGWSMELFVDELSRYYNEILDGKETTTGHTPVDKLQYVDYIEWMSQQKQVLTEQMDYWKQVLDPDLNVLSIPSDIRRGKVQTHQGNTLERELNENQVSKIKEYCSENKITFFMFMLASFAILLQKLTGSCDIPIGVPVAGRPRKEMENMIGFFVNTVVMRCHVHPDDKVKEFLEYIKKTSLEAFENQDIPFEEIIQNVCPERDMSHSPLVQVMLNVQNTDGIQCNLKGIQAAPYPLVQQRSKFDMTLYVEENLGKIKLNYNCNLFGERRAWEYLNQLDQIISSILLKRELRIWEISLQTSEFQAVLGKTQPLLQQKSGSAAYRIEELFSQMVRKYPDNIAISDSKKYLTYQQLDKESNRLAFALMGREIGREDIVIIYGARNKNLITSMLAVLKSGAAFCIFDPEHPEERLQRQLQIVNAKLMICVHKMTDGMKISTGLQLNCESFEQLMAGTENIKISLPEVKKDVNDTAYILFTSGTTGMPNCVCTPHGPVCHFITWFIERYHMDSSSVFGLFAGLAHDPLIREVFTPLSVGGKLAIRNRESKYEIEETFQWMAAEGINEVSITPSLFMMITEGNNIVISGIRHYFFCGENLTSIHVRRAHKVSPGTVCVNFYGATETPQVMGYFEIPEDFDPVRKLIPIGQGIDEVQLYLSNDHDMKAGLGELGEVYIKTLHLSKGYLNNEQLNEKNFSFSGKNDGLRIYRTGDFGRYQWDGSIVLQGRKDEQINIRGYRIETREIIMALMTHDNVRNAAISQMDGRNGTQVAAFLVLKDKSLFDTNAMRHFLKRYIPINVLPERFCILDMIPLTPNGKVDFRKLQKEFRKPLKSANFPRNDIERRIKKIWSDVLNTDDFGIDDNFFDIGGHSLLLAQVKAQLDVTFDMEIKILNLFNYPTVSMLCGYIKTLMTDSQLSVDSIVETMQNRTQKQRQAFGKFKHIRRK